MDTSASNAVIFDTDTVTPARTSIVGFVSTLISPFTRCIFSSAEFLVISAVQCAVHNVRPIGCGYQRLTSSVCDLVLLEKFATFAKCRFHNMYMPLLILESDLFSVVITHLSNNKIYIYPSYEI